MTELWRKAQDGETPEGYLVVFDGPGGGALNCHTAGMLPVEGALLIEDGWDAALRRGIESLQQWRRDLDFVISDAAIRDDIVAAVLRAAVGEQP